MLELSDIASHSNNIILHMNIYQHNHMFIIDNICPFIETWKPDVWCI